MRRWGRQFVGAWKNELTARSRKKRVKEKSNNVQSKEKEEKPLLKAEQQEQEWLQMERSQEDWGVSQDVRTKPTVTSNQASTGKCRAAATFNHWPPATASPFPFHSASSQLLYRPMLGLLHPVLSFPSSLEVS